MSALAEVKNLAEYLRTFGPVLSKKAIHSLHPLHVPKRDPVPSFDYVPEHRTPFEAQAHLISGAVKGMTASGACFIIGEPGCGKTISACLSVHEHAMKSRRQGGYGGKYRAIVICPDHLISKWKNEIEDTIPGVVVHCWRPDGDEGTGMTLSKWSDFLNLMKLGRTDTKLAVGDQPMAAEPKLAPVSETYRFTLNADGTQVLDEVYVSADRPIANPLSGKVMQERKRWVKPNGPEWIVVGRDQIKRSPEWSGLGSHKMGFDGNIHHNQPCKLVVTDRKPIANPDGSYVIDDKGRIIQKPVIEKRIICPQCGTVPTKKGITLSWDTFKKKKGQATPQFTCKALIMEEIGEPEKKSNGLDRIYQHEEKDGYAEGRRPGIPYEHRKALPGAVVSHAGKKWRLRECGEPFYQYVKKPNWWPAAKILQGKLSHIAQYLVVDECHEQKSDESAQSMAMGKILGSTRYCLALTGTFIGGYANDLFPLLIRMAARDMQARQFEWGSVMPFVERYGCIDRIVRSEVPVQDEGVNSKGGGSRSMRKAKPGTSKVERKCRPGIMPTLFSEMVMPLAMFLKLEQFIDDLPGFEEKMIACDLPPDIQQAYNTLANTLAAANRDMIKDGNMKLMGTMLWTLLTYPDQPWGWEPMFRASKPGEEDTHAVGWWRKAKVFRRTNFVGVASPENFDPDAMILPKERQLIDLVKKNTEAGDQTWVYCEMTGKRDVMARLAKLMEAEGLRVGVLRRDDVSPKERELWIQKNGYLYDVMLSHPQLVATGLDLFSVSHGNHNFNHLVFYQTGFNLFRLRQASRRGWRIGQPKDCTVTYFYYSDTSQAAALALMGRKAQAAQQLEEGCVSDEGLAAMGGDAGAQAALVKALGEHIDPAEIQRNWSKVSGGSKRERKPRPERPKARPMAALPVPPELYEDEGVPPPGVSSPFDHLPIQMQIVGESMVKAVESARTVDDALSDFRSWLGQQKPDGKPALKVATFEDEAETEPPKPTGPKPLEEFSRDELASMFDQMRAGTLKEDDWDW